MFCTACAAPNPRPGESCASCGAPLPGHRSSGGRARGATLADRLHLALALALPLALLLAVAGYQQSTQEARAAAYTRADQALARGDPEAAIVAFADAGDYRDAATRLTATETALAPYHALYQRGVAALATGDVEGAIAALLPIVRVYPAYRDAALLLGQARAQRLADLEAALERAIAEGDWLTAERVATALVAADPGDPDYLRQLDTLRRDHSPLLFSRRTTLYLIGPDGRDERALLAGMPAVWPVWSPDRSRIAFISPDGNGRLTLYVVNVDGSGLTRLGDWLRPYEPPVWSPDGTRIAFVSTAALPGTAPGGAGEIPAPLPAPELRVVEVATGLLTDPTGGRIANVTYPTWSPAGDRIAVVSRPLDGSVQQMGDRADSALNVVTLASGEISNPATGRIAHPWRIAWSPARDQIVVWTRAPGQAYDAERTPLYLVDLTTGAIADLNQSRALVTMPVWSPDGRMLAYLENWTHLRLYALTGTGQTILLPEASSEFLTWAPDASAIFLAGGGNPSRIIRLSGEEAGRTTPFPLDYDTNRRQAGAPQWAPLSPLPTPVAPSVAGTARDGAGEAAALRRN